jgi:drug/metabolite transporter (DMT)-like permease
MRPTAATAPSPSTVPLSPTALRVGLALAAVYVIWGSTFLVIRVALAGLPPFTLAGGRFLLAGVVLFCWALWQGAPVPRGLQAWGRPALAGALLFVGGNGVVVWAQQRVTSGLAALLVASVPLWVVVLGWASGGVRPHRRTLWGLAAGAGGVTLLVAGRGRAATGELAAMVALLASSASWAAGSLYTRGNPKDVPPLLLSAQAMLAGGALLLGFGGASGEWRGLSLAAVPLSAWASVAYLSFFGSVVAFSAYAWLLRSVSPALASSYAFVNPGVAVLLGWAFLGEPVGAGLLLGGAAIVVAVGLLSTASGKGAPAAPRPPAPVPVSTPLPVLAPVGRGS